MKKILFLLLSCALFLQAQQYTNCHFKNKDYEAICYDVTRKGVSLEYANTFLLSYFKTLFYDEITWKYIQPSKIAYHRKKEQQANTILLRYIPKMVQHLQKYKNVYDVAEQRYGVNREIIAAILLKETKLGTIKPSHDAFKVFNTILVRTQANTPRNKRLIAMAKSNISAIIAHCYRAHITPEECNLPSSYAGAVGIPQFMPESFVYARSFTGKVPDITTMADAILSAASFLHHKANFTKLLEWKAMGNIARIEKEWYTYANNYDDASFVYEKKKDSTPYHCFTKNKPKLQALRVYVKKIMRYNNSSNYALGVMRLAYEAHKKLSGTLKPLHTPSTSLKTH